jgi:hypothetical protein
MSHHQADKVTKKSWYIQHLTLFHALFVYSWDLNLQHKIIWKAKPPFYAVIIWCAYNINLKYMFSAHHMFHDIVSWNFNHTQKKCKIQGDSKRWTQFCMSIFPELSPSFLITLYYKALHMSIFLWYEHRLMMGFIHNPKHDAIKLPNT